MSSLTDAAGPGPGVYRCRCQENPRRAHPKLDTAAASELRGAASAKRGLKLQIFGRSIQDVMRPSAGVARAFALECSNFSQIRNGPTSRLSFRAFTFTKDESTV
jgi:hypothetical protein